MGQDFESIAQKLEITDVLYRYATAGQAVGGFSTGDLEAPFSKSRAARTPARGGGSARRKVEWWPWVVSAVIGAAVVAAVELNKHHYAAHRLSGRIFAGILIWVVLTVILRLIAAGYRSLDGRTPAG